jgi:spoIIIJ-associated protein
MRSIESEGESIDQAIDRALQALQVERDRVEVEILADATKGLFGFGGKKARVRATVRAPLARLELGGDHSSRANVSRESLPADATPRTVETSRPPRPQREVASDARPTDGSAPPIEARARDVLTEILTHLGVSCTVQRVPGDDPEVVALHVDGDSSGLLIGRRGQMLDALEYIVNRIVAKGEDSGGTRVTIDVERYRERRREYLENLAQRLADKAKQTGRPVTLNPMSPRDRRTVHLALQKDGGISTRSQGQGYYRKLLILPADRGRGHHARTDRRTDDDRRSP